jgi:dipeptidyl aminopeptidase/acylaminoacyl peptidase
MGSSDEPYLRDITHEGFFQDWYLVDLENGERTKVAERISNGGAMLTPKGHRVLYYNDKNWHVYNVDTKQTRNITEGLNIPFYNEDHDYPSQVPGYGIGGWVNGGDAALIYDKYDIWQIPLIRGNFRNITEGKGREEKRIFRVRSLDNDNIFRNDDDLLLTSYHDLKKNFGFYSAKVNQEGIKKLLEEDKKFTFVSKADDSDKILFKREAYDEFPNLWVSNDWKFKKTKQISKLHMDLKKKWNWGSAELVDWLSLDGTYIQGVVIKPDNYDPNKRYPIMTYYYRFFTNRLHDFNEPKTNHRPVFAQYVSDGYVVFLPDIRFEIGRPGFAATKSLVPGIQKLIELGIADEDKLGLHGHSWSGYQTAFIVTQTDIFDAAVSGAPVSNMTSAYSGIRWGSGLARQFQYEKTQSRIGQSLIEAPEKYIENSPVFFADKITTPILIQHGDADGAVPWYQSIEMYLAMRRYNKDVIFLQYHDEPHHLQKFPNKLDYAIRMKEYFDYYLKGVGEPEWILSGETFQGR